VPPIRQNPTVPDWPVLAHERSVARTVCTGAVSPPRPVPKRPPTLPVRDHPTYAVRAVDKAAGVQDGLSEMTVRNRQSAPGVRRRSQGSITLIHRPEKVAAPAEVSAAPISRNRRLRATTAVQHSPGDLYRSKSPRTHRTAPAIEASAPGPTIPATADLRAPVKTSGV
jgi:hypothetical protein